MNESSRARPIEILLVEDNYADVRLTEEVFKQCRVPHRLSVVSNGEEAMAWLRRDGAYAAKSRPDLILLDLNLPRMDGRAVLAAVKTDAHLKSIPIVVLSSSSADSDLTCSYELHANCYLIKPLGLEAFEAVMREIEVFWLMFVKLPQGGK
jgi:two-component system, chemotaxis family, response regulator Rcp1